jgi:hypothetical protein
MILEDERRALAAFVNKFDALGLGDFDSIPPSRLPTTAKPFENDGPAQNRAAWLTSAPPPVADERPARQLDFDRFVDRPSLLLEESPNKGDWSGDDISFEFIEHSGTPKAARVGAGKATMIGLGF